MAERLNLKMQNPKQKGNEIQNLMPSEEQLQIILENLFERQRLIELAHRCTMRDEELDLRQAKTHELIEILINAWKSGPKRNSGSLWGAIDQDLAGRLKNYLGLGENKLRDMLSVLQSEGSYDRKTSSTLLWVLLHEKHESLLSEFGSVLNHRFRDSGSLLAGRPLCIGKFNDVEELIAGMSRELKALLIEQTREIESLKARLEKLEESTFAKRDSEAFRRRLKDLPPEKIRVGIFVDVQNMFYAAKKLDGARLDYESMLDRIVSNRRLIRAVAYIVESSEIDQSGFISVLEKKGYQVRRKELKSFMDGTAKGDWDMGMAIDILETTNHLDVVALVTGDGDFVSLVRLVKKLGPMVELYAFGHNLSGELKETSDKFFEIGSELLLKNFHHQAPAEGAQKESGSEKAGDTPAQKAEKTGKKQ